MNSRFSAAVRFSEPPLGTRFRALGGQPCAPTPQSWLRIPGVDRQPGRLRPRRRLHTSEPRRESAERDIMPLGKRVQALPGNELLRDLPLELNAVGTLSGHGFHPLKAQLTLSNHYLKLSGPRGALHCMCQDLAVADTSHCRLVD